MFQCDFCDKWFTSKCTLVSHESVHMGEKPYKCVKAFQCRQCSKIFLDKHNFFKHIETHSDSQRPDECPNISCSTCPKLIFSNKNQPIQGGEQCPSCIGASSKSTISEDDCYSSNVPHKAVTTEDFTCVFCLKNFKSSSTLDIHLLLHTRERTFGSTRYKKTSTRKSVKNKTKKSIFGNTQSHSCKLCGKTFKQRSHMIRHVKAHLEEKLYKCAVCDKRFLRMDYLKIHSVLHTGERFKCQNCHKTYSNRGTLWTHQKKGYCKKLNAI